MDSWMILVLLIGMQGGFALFSSGLTRTNGAHQALLRSFLNLLIPVPLLYLIGFRILTGTGWHLGLPDSLVSGIPAPLWFLIQAALCAIALAIFSSSLSERGSFVLYFVFAAVISLAIYPAAVYLLSKTGLQDAAGAASVHLLGGSAACVSACLLGPRSGKYSKEKKSTAIPGHSAILATIGAMILVVCWLGFNGVNSMGSDSKVLWSIAVNTLMALSGSTLSSFIFEQRKYRKPDLSVILNGGLCGLVAISTASDRVSPLVAFCIGIIAGVIVFLCIERIDKTFHIDDPVGVISVHGIGAIVGLLMVGLFSKSYGTDRPEGLFVGGTAHLLGSQLLGIGLVLLVTIVPLLCIGLVLKKANVLKSTPQESVLTLDLSQASQVQGFQIPVQESQRTENVIQAGQFETQIGNHSMTRVSLVIQQGKFDALKNALEEIGVSGMTVSNVIGYGTTRGYKEYYRGVMINPTLLPKIKVEIVICKVPVDLVINTAMSVLYTGKVGDGKIFVETIDNVVKVRTGEQGYDALQDD